MSTCPLISFPGEKSIWETQLPSEHCLENTESELGELDYPGNIIMRIWQTDESPSFSPGLDLSSRLNIFSSLVQETAHKNAFSLLFFQVILLLLRVFVITSISWPFFISHIVVTNQFPISNFFCIYCILQVDCFPGDYLWPTIPHSPYRNTDPIKVSQRRLI